MDIEAAAQAAASHIIHTVCTRTAGNVEVAVIAYREEDHDSAWTGCRDREEHMRLLKRTAELVEPSGITIALRVFDREDYSRWLNGRPDTKTMRSEWASQTGMLRYAFKLGASQRDGERQPIGWAVYRLSGSAGTVIESGEEHL